MGAIIVKGGCKNQFIDFLITFLWSIIKKDTYTNIG